jgi:hypothetical protein
MLETEREIFNSDLFNKFTQWCEDSKIKSEKNNISFHIHLGKWLGGSKKWSRKIKGKPIKGYTLIKEEILAVFKKKGMFQNEEEGFTVEDKEVEVTVTGLDF